MIANRLLQSGEILRHVHRKVVELHPVMTFEVAEHLHVPISAIGPALAQLRRQGILASSARQVLSGEREVYPFNGWPPKYGGHEGPLDVVTWSVIE